MKKEVKNKVLRLRVDEDTDALIRNLAKVNNTSISNIIRLACYAYNGMAKIDIEQSKKHIDS